MKTPEEWRLHKLPWQHKDAVDNTNQYLYTDNEIKQIQLDAWQDGMATASECVRQAIKEIIDSYPPIDPNTTIKIYFKTQQNVNTLIENKTKV